MMEKEIAFRGLAALTEDTAVKAQVRFDNWTKHELYVQNGRLSLLRTTHDPHLAQTVITGSRRGSYSSNRTDAEGIRLGAATALKLAQASPEDSAYDIAEKQPAETFLNGPEEPDRELMYTRLASFLEEVREHHPHVIIKEAGLSFDFCRSAFLNSNGVDFSAVDGSYNFFVLFSSKKAGITTSFNHTWCSMRDLSRHLLDRGTVRETLARSEKELEAGPFRGKTEGDIVIDPDCMAFLIYMWCGTFIADGKLIAGTSPLKDSLGKDVAAAALTLRSEPRSEELTSNYFYTRNGYKAENSVIIDRGVLRSFLLSLYGSRKTGKPRAVNDGECHVVDAGGCSRDDLVSSVKRGLYVVRISGGHPNDRGDFSFVAKNSFLIENGEIAAPVNEVMISGNMLDLFRNIRGISRERINFGACIYPWVLAGPLVISGK